MRLRIRKFIAGYFTNKWIAYKVAGIWWQQNYGQGSYGYARGDWLLAWGDLMHSMADAFYKEDGKND